LIDELINREGRVQRSITANRQKTENRIRTEWINTYHATAKRVTANPDKENLATLKVLVDHGKPESEEAELELMKQHIGDYGKIYEHLEKLTNSFSGDEILLHDLTAELLLDLCRGERKWAFLTEEERKKMTKNRLIQCTADPKQCLKAVFTKKLISYLRKGKITLTLSFKYQDIGRVIETVELSDDDWVIIREDVEKLIEGMYPINFESESFQRSPPLDNEEDAQDYQTLNKIPFQQVQNQISELIADYNPEWFQSHKEIFEKMTDGMFEMEYDELTFLIRLYEAIGFLGRNLRFSDSPSFYRLQYFIQRYLSDATLDLDDLIQLVETSNRQKRVVRIVERGVTRVSEPNVSLCEAFLIKLF
jgi:hypothetical protein